MSVWRIVPVVILIVAAGFLVTRIGGEGGAGSLLSLEGPGSSKPTAQTADRRSQGSGQQQGSAGESMPTPEAAPIDSLDEASVRKEAFILLNPASATLSSTIGVAGSGFDPASVIDLYLTADPKNDKQPTELGFAQTDSGGSFGSFSFSLPPNYRAPTFTVIAKQRNSSREAMATGRLEALRPSVKLGTNVGAVGDLVQISAQGFMPDEEVEVYFNSLAGDPFASYRAGSGGTIEKEAVRIPYGPVGNNSLIFVGSESQSPVTVPFLMLALYPNVALSSYAAKADTVLAFSGSGFGPDEDVTVHLNNPQSPPIVKFRTAEDGTFENAGAFLIPFELTGKNTLIFVGEKSQATATAGFDVLPYTPNVQPSTYGGRPGTTITFYGDGFARDEVVRVYVDRTRDSPGRQVSCAKADSQGRIGAGGSYTIPADAQAGQQVFTFVGSRSRAVTTSAIEVMEAGVPVQVPAEPETEFRCPFDDEESVQQEQTPAPAAPAQVPPTPQRPQSQARPGVTPQPRPTATPTRPQAGGVVVPSSGQSGQDTRTVRPAVVSGAGGPVEVRSDPSAPSGAGASVAPNSRVELLGDVRTVGIDQWVLIRTEDGQEGWVPARSIQVSQERARQPSGQ